MFGVIVRNFSLKIFNLKTLKFHGKTYNETAVKLSKFINFDAVLETIIFRAVTFSKTLRYLKQYKKLPKHDSNERFNFVVYQAALDASVLYLKDPVLSKRLEATVRWYIHTEGVSQCDEPHTRMKIDATKNPKITHADLYVGLGEEF